MHFQEQHILPIMRSIIICSWTRAGIITSTQDLWRTTAEATKDVLEANGKTVIFRAIEPTVEGYEVRVSAHVWYIAVFHAIEPRVEGYEVRVSAHVWYIVVFHAIKPTVEGYEVWFSARVIYRNLPCNRAHSRGLWGEGFNTCVIYNRLPCYRAQSRGLWGEGFSTCSNNSSSSML